MPQKKRKDIQKMKKLTVKAVCLLASAAMLTACAQNGKTQPDTEGKLVIGDCEEVLENFSKDTRQIKENDTYVAIKGANFDGNKFWKQALEKDAKAVIVQDIDFSKEDLTKYKNKIIIKTKDVLESLYEIAKYKRSLYDIPVVGVTGSVGKRTWRSKRYDRYLYRTFS